MLCDFIMKLKHLTFLHIIYHDVSNCDFNLLLMKLKRSFYFAVPTSSLTFPVAQRFTSPEFLENSIFRFDVFVANYK